MKQPLIMDLWAVRNMWRAVVLEALRNLVMTDSGGHAALLAHQVKCWIGSRDFCTTCDLAGIDAGAVAAFAHRRRALFEAGQIASAQDGLIIKGLARSGARRGGAGARRLAA